MRVLHILDHSLPLHSGYVFRTMGILKAQRELGWDTVHLTTPKHELASLPVEDIDGWRFHRTAAPSGPLSRVRGGHELASMMATASRLEEIVRDTSPDILHAHSPVLTALPALRVGRKIKIPVVYEVRAFWEDAAVDHGTHRPWGLRYRATRWLETMALKRADATTTICEGLRQDILARGIGSENVTVVPNAIDIEEFRPAAEPDRDLASRLGIVDSTVLGFIGSFYAYEGLDFLIEALPRIIALVPDLRVLLVGGGPEEARLRDLGNSLGLESRIVFTGRVPHDQVGKYYDLVDIFVYPRRSIRLTELVTPLKPLEALARERIVLASDVGGHRELLEHGQTGFLFKADDPDDLVKQVQSVIARRTEWPRIRASGRKFVEQERTWQTCAARYTKVYDSALKRLA